MRQIINESDFSVSWMKKYKREIKSCKGKKQIGKNVEGRGLGGGGISTLTGGSSGDVANRVWEELKLGCKARKNNIR